MTNLNRPARLNRVLLGVLGFVLLAAGAFTVATHFDLTVFVADAPLAPELIEPPTWAFVVTACVAIVLGLLCLRWILAQLARAPKARTWRFEQDPALGRTELATSTAVAPFVDEVTAYPGVHAVRATLAGRREAPALAMVVSAEQDGDLADIRRRIDTVGLPRLRQALDLDVVPVTIEFRFSSRTRARTL
ncbi:alkaline shock response membrane anchor protein AmaP [Umezawaea endophytica]|uniref:Alkaline shock response membrane anchor protein AmaP n=1 Tax=Umezawaea endophytica TaxID=1654476 RepID=A0A9X3AFA9_9PSEU|nr:alkaline shock response membrane anchor protein AmaP [Umezawaea endophytica]MCS7478517.1 alkaline shock response membrane anchor protein AmaP [Umezawaea endophytica]